MAPQETARLEAEAYELEQKTALAAEAKAVLDSWVRYEGQVKQRQQKELADSIIAKVQKELENPKVLQQILAQSVADVESAFTLAIQPLTHWDFPFADTAHRDRLLQGPISAQHRQRRYSILGVSFVPSLCLERPDTLCNSQFEDLESQTPVPWDPIYLRVKQ